MVDDLTTLLFPSQGYTSLPLCEADGLVCCTASGPGGHALRVMIDTGTDPSAVDSGLARRLALRTGGSGLGSGAASDEVPFTEAVVPWLRLGELTVRDLFAPAVELRSLPFEVDIVLGYNVLRQLALRIDYRRGLLTLAHPDLGAPAPARPASVLPLVFFEQFPALECFEVAGRPVPLATIDTGSNAALTLGQDVAHDLGLLAGATELRVASGAGFGGGADVLRGHLQPVQIGEIAVDGVELDIPANARGDLGRAGRVNIGNRLLARFGAVALDYERRQLTLEL
jgi:predicted aspartyl protease